MSKYIDAEKLYKQVDSLMARYAKNEEEFEVDDEELSIFYQGKSKMCSEVLKIIDFLQQEQLPGIEDPGVPGRDFIPVEWVDACEKYGKWKIVQQEQDYSDLSDLERAIHRGFLCAGVENVPVAIIKETAKEVQSILKAEG